MRATYDDAIEDRQKTKLVYCGHKIFKYWVTAKQSILHEVLYESQNQSRQYH